MGELSKLKNIGKVVEQQLFYVGSEAPKMFQNAKMPDKSDFAGFCYIASRPLIASKSGMSLII